MTGKVKKIMKDKGFGFIEADDGSELFFHNSGCEPGTFSELVEGSKVSFDATEGMKGPRAESVRSI